MARPARDAFWFLADLRNEPMYNHQVSNIAKTSPGPIGPGTTFKGNHRGFGHVTWCLSEFEAPRHLAIEGEVGGGDYRWVSDFEPVPGGTQMTGKMEWQPGRPWRILRPVVEPLLRLNARRAFGRFARVVEKLPAAGV